MKWNESGLSSLEIVIIMLVALGVVCLLGGVFFDEIGAYDIDKSIHEKSLDTTFGSKKKG